VSTFAVLPIKTFARAKTRLGGDPARAEAMAAAVLRALGQVRSLEAVLVVTREPRVKAEHIVHDPHERGHSEAALLGIEAALARGARRVLLVPGDCPLLDATEVEALLDFAGPGVTIVPDRHGTGTNALVLDPPGAMAPAFGPGSCARHAALAQRAGVRVSIRRVPSLAFDVDTPEDLAALPQAA
jgi:2-phospho-L-lactate guanylyltransferase